MSHNNSGSSGSILTNFSQSTCRRSDVITRVQFSEGPSLKICESEKNVHNSAQFLTTFDFDREYLRNRPSYRQSSKTIINYNPFHVGQKKIGELWSTNNKVKVAHIDQPKWTFFGR